MARGVVIPAEGGVAKIADPGVVYMTRVGSLKMTDWGRLQCRFTHHALGEEQAGGLNHDNGCLKPDDETLETPHPHAQRLTHELP